MSNPENGGDTPPVVSPETETMISSEAELKRSHEIGGENSLLQRVQLKFRNAVGRAMEEIPDEKIRNGIKEIQEEVVNLLKHLQEKSGLDDESLQFFEDEIIKSKVEAFISKMALGTERALIKQVLARNKVLSEGLNSTQEELRREMYDEMTGLLQKKYLQNRFKDMLSMLQREAHDNPSLLALMFFDIDHFKKVNDTYGHQAGDSVIAGVGRIVRENFQRESDAAGKYGGDEFVVVMPKCNAFNAALKAENIRKKIEETKFTAFKDNEKVEFNVTVSIGVLIATLRKFLNANSEKTMEYLVKQADVLLYESKQKGRNRVSPREIEVGETEAGETEVEPEQSPKG
jgi:diguanylate cyclase (GGDEF)-like protein